MLINLPRGELIKIIQDFKKYTGKVDNIVNYMYILFLLSFS